MKRIKAICFQNSSRNSFRNSTKIPNGEIVWLEIPKEFCCHLDLSAPHEEVDEYLTKKGYGILLSKLFWPTVRKKCSSVREKLLKFEAEGREFAKILRSLEQFIQTVNFW